MEKEEMGLDIKLDVNKVLSDLAEGLGVAVEKLYPILYKQAIIEGIYNLLVLVSIAALWWFLFRVGKGSVKSFKRDFKENKSWTSDNWLEHLFDKHIIQGLSSIFFCLGIIAFGVVTIVMVPDLIKDSVTAFFNTDYYIINDIVDKFTN